MRKKLLVVLILFVQARCFAQQPEKRFLYGPRINGIRNEGIINDEMKIPIELPKPEKDFRVVSFIVGKFLFKNVRNENIFIKRSLHSKVFARSIPHDLSRYQLDAVYDARVSELQWPVNDVLFNFPKQLNANTIGIFGMLSSEASYSPVYISNLKHADNDSLVRIAVTPVKEYKVKEVIWRLVDKKSGKTLSEWQHVPTADGKEFFRRDEKIWIEMRYVPAVYILEIRAKWYDETEVKKNKNSPPWDDITINIPE